jgi:NSS family neurotransmitter:Na+ symporter
VIATFCSLSLGKFDGLSLFGLPLFDLFDFFTAQILLPVGGFLTCIFLGWFVPKQTVRDELTNGGTLRGTFFAVYLFLIRFVCPLCILAVFLHQFGVFHWAGFL